MKIKDGLELRGRPIEIPNCGREDLVKFFVEQGYKVGAEIGVDRGEYTKVLCEAGLKVYGVDAWVNYEGYKRKGKYKSHIEQAKKNLKGYDCELIHKYSVDAAKDFKDNSLDFVYIDSNHTLPYIVQDIFLWERKVRRGGIISGHDYAVIFGGPEITDRPKWYGGCHVKVGVDACADIMHIQKYYVLGERFVEEPNWRDTWRSWFWIKKI